MKSPKKEGIIMVKDLIDDRSEKWNYRLIKEVFCQKEVSSILATPISHGGCPDQLIWHYEKSNTFTVKSA
ncbi:hypothetical protein Syun_011926 [Stephania yunnanensis]|uniref:Uncharacterized protein n=1 Tax=Stephania yunnanensis TaxID=152371 RepID=A0AAP0PIY9_9MAGN